MGSPDVVVVYIHGYANVHGVEDWHGYHHNTPKQDTWYRVEFETKRDDDKLVYKKTSSYGREKIRCRRPRLSKKIYPVATMCPKEKGSAGNWAVIGDNIYWAGGYTSDNNDIISFSKDLLKHNVTAHSTDLTSWEIESSSMNILRRTPLVAAIGSKKLCVVADTLHRSYDDESDRCSNTAGIYDLDDKTWKYLDADIKSSSPYDNSFFQAAVVEKDGSSQIVFYSLDTGSVLFLDVTSGTLDGPATHVNFALWQHSERELLPEGLTEYGYGMDLGTLQHVTRDVPAVFSNDTFYWFTDMCLFGYDTKAERWFNSPELENQFPSHCYYSSRKDILVGLRNGNFLVIVGDDRGELIMAYLTVAKEENSLSVSVESIQPLSFDDHSFEPYDAKAM